MVQSCVIINCFGIKKKKAGDTTQIKIKKHRILLFHTSINSYLDTMNGKETLLKMISQSEACGCNRKMRAQCSHSLLAERVKSLDNVISTQFWKPASDLQEKKKSFHILKQMSLLHAWPQDQENSPPIFFLQQLCKRWISVTGETEQVESFTHFILW